MIRFNEVVSSAMTIGAGKVPDGLARHQVAVADGAGTLEVLVDFGCGLTSMKVINAADGQRAPYCIEGEVDQIRFVPSASLLVCYRAEKV